MVIGYILEFAAGSFSVHDNVGCRLINKDHIYIYMDIWMVILRHYLTQTQWNASDRMYTFQKAMKSKVPQHTMMLNVLRHIEEPFSFGLGVFHP